MFAKVISSVNPQGVENQNRLSGKLAMKEFQGRGLEIVGVPQPVAGNGVGILVNTANGPVFRVRKLDGSLVWKLDLSDAQAKLRSVRTFDSGDGILAIASREAANGMAHYTAAVYHTPERDKTKFNLLATVDLGQLPNDLKWDGKDADASVAFAYRSSTLYHTTYAGILVRVNQQAKLYVINMETYSVGTKTWDCEQSAYSRISWMSRDEGVCTNGFEPIRFKVEEVDNTPMVVEQGRVQYPNRIKMAGMQFKASHYLDPIENTRYAFAHYVSTVATAMVVVNMETGKSVYQAGYRDFGIQTENQCKGEESTVFALPAQWGYLPAAAMVRMKNVSETTTRVDVQLIGPGFGTRFASFLVHGYIPGRPTLNGNSGNRLRGFLTDETLYLVGDDGLVVLNIYPGLWNDRIQAEIKYLKVLKPTLVHQEDFSQGMVYVCPTVFAKNLAVVIAKGEHRVVVVGDAEKEILEQSLQDRPTAQADSAALISSAAQEAGAPGSNAQKLESQQVMSNEASETKPARTTRKRTSTTVPSVTRQVSRGAISPQQSNNAAMPLAAKAGRKPTPKVAGKPGSECQPGSESKSKRRKPRERRSRVLDRILIKIPQVIQTTTA